MVARASAAVAFCCNFGKVSFYKRKHYSPKLCCQPACCCCCTWCRICGVSSSSVSAWLVKVERSRARCTASMYAPRCCAFAARVFRPRSATFFSRFHVSCSFILDFSPILVLAGMCQHVCAVGVWQWYKGRFNLFKVKSNCVFATPCWCLGVAFAYTTAGFLRRFVAWRGNLVVTVALGNEVPISCTCTVTVAMTSSISVKRTS